MQLRGRRERLSALLARQHFFPDRVASRYKPTGRNPESAHAVDAWKLSGSSGEVAKSYFSGCSMACKLRANGQAFPLIPQDL